jgi:hypothetical protein
MFVGINSSHGIMAVPLTPVLLYSCLLQCVLWFGSGWLVWHCNTVPHHAIIWFCLVGGDRYPPDIRAGGPDKHEHFVRMCTVSYQAAMECHRDSARVFMSARVAFTTDSDCH